MYNLYTAYIFVCCLLFFFFCLYTHLRLLHRKREGILVFLFCSFGWAFFFFSVLEK